MLYILVSRSSASAPAPPSTTVAIARTLRIVGCIGLTLIPRPSLRASPELI